MQQQPLPNGIYIVFAVGGNTQVYFAAPDEALRADLDAGEEKLRLAAEKAPARYFAVAGGQATMMVSELQQELTTVRAKLLEFMQPAKDVTGDETE